LGRPAAGGPIPLGATSTNISRLATCCGFTDWPKQCRRSCCPHNQRPRGSPACSGWDRRDGIDHRRTGRWREKWRSRPIDGGCNGPIFGDIVGVVGGAPMTRPGTAEPSHLSYGRGESRGRFSAELAGGGRDDAVRMVKWHRGRDRFRSDPTNIFRVQPQPRGAAGLFSRSASAKANRPSQTACLAAVKPAGLLSPPMKPPAAKSRTAIRFRRDDRNDDSTFSVRV
jgi:hypothetical protein